MEKDSTNWLITVWPNRVKEENGFGIVSFSLKKNSDAFFDSIQIGDRIYIYEQGAAPESKPRIHDGCSSVYARGVCQEICKEENKTQRIIKLSGFDEIFFDNSLRSSRVCQVLGVSSSKLSSREFNAFFNLTEKGEELAIDFEKICDRQKMNAEFVENELANPFRLIRFSISNHGKTLYDIKFCNPEQNSMPVQPFVSLLLGDNGAGKSFVLSQLVDVIRFLRKFYRDSKIDTLKYDTYKLEYRAWTNHCITLSRKTVYDKNDNCGYEVTDDCSKSPKSGLPSHLLAVAFSNDDKFGFSRNKEFYAYLGLRTVSNAAFLKSTKDIFLDRLILRKCVKIT